MSTSNEERSEVVFFDNFAGPELNRDAWNVRHTGPIYNNEQQAYVDSPETLYIEETPDTDNGHALVLHPRYRPGFVTPEGNTFDFISGRIDTRSKVEFTYGRAEARMRLAAGTGFWPAFWAMGADNKWPDAGEIDIMENIGEPDWVNSAVHGPGYSGEDGLVNYRYFPEGEDATGWHVYSVDWSPDQMIFKVDGHLIYRITVPMITFFGEWRFNNPKYLILNFALGGVYPFKINGVESPYYGLPQETVETLKAEEATVKVDWVRVSKLS